MDNGLTIEAPDSFVVNVVQVTGGAAGFAVGLNVPTFTVKVNLSTDGGTSPLVGEEYTTIEKNKLANIEVNAKDDLTSSEIKVLYEGENDTNAYTDLEKAKLDDIESDATADQTPTEIRVAVAAATDSNVYTDAAVAKLAGIETAAKDDQTGSEIKALYEVMTNAFNDAQFNKLAGIEGGATADQSASEIEAAYNAQVDKISGAEIAQGSETAVRRVSPADMKALVLAHAPAGGSMTDQEVADAYANIVGKVSAGEITAGTEPALRTYSPADVKAMVVEHAGASGMTDAQVKTAYENNPDTNVHTDAQVTKLAGIEPDADVSPTPLTNDQIATAVEAASDSNTFTDADHSKLGGIAAGAEVNIADIDFYDLGMDFLGVPADGQIIARWVVLREITMAADFTGAAGNILTNPTATLAIDIKDDGTTIGTVSISSAGAFTFTTVSGTAKVVAAGSVVTATAPGTADTTGSDIVFTLPGAL